MKLLTDYHIHSKDSRFFHGKNKIEELVLEANENGLQEIAITDHGFKHLFRTSKSKLAKARKIVDEINEWSKTKVMLGIEADIIAEDGTIDVDNETIEMLDMLIIGYHKMIKTDFAGFFGNVPKTEEARRKCTNAFINAIEKYPVTIVSHLDSILTTNLYEIGKACALNNVMVEINNRHTKWTQKQVDDLVASGCLFVVSSDAHSREQVANVSNAFDIIKKYNIPSEQVVNVKFEEYEKSENDKELEIMLSIYKQKQEEREKKELKNEKKKRYEFTESLSPEMEKALREIAQEKGLSYHNKNEVQNEDEGEYLRNIGDLFTTEDDIQLIREAQEFIAKNSMKEFETQNEKLNELDADVAEKSETENVEIEKVEVSETPQTHAQKVEDMIAVIKEESSDKKVEVFEETPEKKEEQRVEQKEDISDGAINIFNVNASVERKGVSEKQDGNKNVHVIKNEPAKKKKGGGFMNDNTGFVGLAERNKTQK